MNAWIRNQVMKLVGMAMISAGILTIVPQSRIKKTVSLVCAMGMVLEIMSIFSGFDFKTYAEKTAAYRMELSRLISSVDDTEKKLTRSIIERESGAYILDKGEKIGIEIIKAKVTAKWSDEEKCWYPARVKIFSDAAKEQMLALSEAIEGDLGIPKSEQIWSNGDEDEF